MAMSNKYIKYNEYFFIILYFFSREQNLSSAIRSGTGFYGVASIADVFQLQASFGCSNKTTDNAIKQMVVAARVQLPNVNAAASSGCRRRKFSGELLCQHSMLFNVFRVSENRKVARITDFRKQAVFEKCFCEIGIIFNYAR